MIIKIQTVPIIRSFGDIAVGDLFGVCLDSDRENRIFIKTDTVMASSDHVADATYNCVDIMTGEFFAIADKFPVKPLFDVEIHSKVFTE